MVELDNSPLPDSNTSDSQAIPENREGFLSANVGNNPLITESFECNQKLETEVIHPDYYLSSKYQSDEDNLLKIESSDCHFVDNQMNIDNHLCEWTQNDNEIDGKIAAAAATVDSAVSSTSLANTNHIFYRANLNAIKHDHPFANNKHETIDKICDEMFNHLSSNQLSNQTSSLNSLYHNNSEPERLVKVPYCIPYGYCLEDDHLVGPSKKLNTSIFNDDDWLLSNKIVNNEKDSSTHYSDVQDSFDYYHERPWRMEDAFQIDVSDKAGPTLAELNSDDFYEIDFGELLASSGDAYLRNNYKKSFGHGYNMNSPLPSIMPSKHLSSPLMSSQVPSHFQQQQVQQQQKQNLLPLTNDEQKVHDSIDYLNSITASTTSVKSTGKSLPSISLKRSASPSPLDTCTPCKILPQNISPITTTNKSRLTNNLSSLTSKSVNLSEKTNSSRTVTVDVTRQQQQQQQQQTNSTVLSTLLSSPPHIENKTIKKLTEENKQTDGSNFLQVPETCPKTRIRNNSMSTDCSFSSHDDEFDSESDASSDDESFYGDYDAKDLLGASTSDDKNNKWALNMGRSRKTGAQRFFWQYNIQSKGPKGTRIRSLEEPSADPHVLCEASDPVFSPDCHIEGVKHAGKARRGDGNDLTPNPKKLLMIGLELKKLSKTINDLTPVAEVPQSSRNKSRKEKNKLASRACRLKKKAQHEANKIKLFGLQQEHKKIMTAIIELKDLLKKSQHTKGIKISYSSKFEQIVAQLGPRISVAGRATDFVNSVLDNVASGYNNGGLDNV